MSDAAEGIRAALDYGGDYMPTTNVRDDAFVALDELVAEVAEGQEKYKYCSLLLDDARGANERLQRDLDATCHNFEILAARCSRLEAQLSEAEGASAKLIAALRAVFQVAAIADEGDPWYCEHEGVDVDEAFALAREALADEAALHHADVTPTSQPAPEDSQAGSSQ